MPHKTKEIGDMNIVRNQMGRIMGVGDWANGFVQMQMPMMTLDQEVQKNGLGPVVNRMRRQGNEERAQELIDRYQQ
jgi:hypothetical protein